MTFRPDRVQACSEITRPNWSRFDVVLASVVGTGLSLPFDVESYGPGDSKYAAGQRLLRRAIEHVGVCVLQPTWWWMGDLPPHLFSIPWAISAYRSWPV